jgi:hypothetical protein
MIDSTTVAVASGLGTSVAVKSGIGVRLGVVVFTGYDVAAGITGSRLGGIGLCAGVQAENNSRTMGIESNLVFICNTLSGSGKT